MMVEYITDSKFDQSPRPEDFHYASQSNVSRGGGVGGKEIIFPIPSLVGFLAASTLSFSGEQVQMEMSEI